MNCPVCSGKLDERKKFPKGKGPDVTIYRCNNMRCLWSFEKVANYDNETGIVWDEKGQCPSGRCD